MSMTNRETSTDRSREPAAVQFENVSLHYESGPEILRNISFELPRGSFHFLTGLSGAGKSSLLSLVHLARRPTSGTLKLFGVDVTRAPRDVLPDLRRRVGFVFQDFRLIDHLSALENVALPLRVAGLRDRDIRRHVTELLDWVGLRDHMDALPATLSGGQQQRVAIARAVISRPDILLADEPTGNVDDTIAVRLLHLFVELNKLGSTVLIATHNEGLVDRFNAPRLHLEDAAIYRIGPPSGLLSERLEQAIKGGGSLR
ncbi:cell division ATP-binding protein FtsE [Phaeovibrio sulfidiphilus]|uniref:Cell division ATP-binding protein FtsE n=1 Tax=Phaeovibrio sulfidiphilus TaxID=1220600 RepID=A0A8J7CPP0_9PROT|nr:cell division ATP-binding protein FtsE [Phaeovibrio sulfidiphilus]MBE1237247.1 cell division ATP-binding protein FtsE [Phaeovibrio sulfidiphilus]